MKKAILSLFAVAAMALNVNAQKAELTKDNATIEWVGKKIGGEHTGTIQLQSGEITLKKGVIKSGTFTIDMTTINNTDMEGEYKGKLEGHLKSPDFFDVAQYNTATLVIKSVKVEGDKQVVTADVTIKGITKEVTFDAYVNGKEITAAINIDRSQFNVRYGSTSFFDSLGDKAIDDIFTMNVTLKL